MLTLHQLQVFAVVAEEMSIGRAADRLVVTQPAVSASVAALQRELGVALIERQGRGIALTDAGRSMQKYAGLVLGLIDEAVAATRATHERVDRPVRVGAASTLVSHVVAPALSRLRERDPDLAFQLSVGNRTQVWRQLAEHETDLAFTTKPPSSQPFVSLATMPNEFVVVARPGQVFAGRLHEATWLIRERGATARAASDEILALLTIEPPTMELDSDDAIMGSLEAGLGVAVLPAAVVGEAVRVRRLVTVPTRATPLSQPWHLIVRREAERHDRVRQFIADLVDVDDRFSWTAEGEVAG